MYFVSINYYQENCKPRLIYQGSCFMSYHHKHLEIPNYSLTIKVVIAKHFKQMVVESTLQLQTESYILQKYNNID